METCANEQYKVAQGVYRDLVKEDKTEPSKELAELALANMTLVENACKESLDCVKKSAPK